MDLPGGRPTPGLDEAIHLLARGEETVVVVREVLRVAARETRGDQALALSRSGTEVVEIAALCGPDPVLRSAVAEALAKGTPVKRSNPVAGLNAGAVPVVVRGEVVGAIGVAGPADALDAGPLDTAAHVTSLALARQQVAAVSSAPLEALAQLPTMSDRQGIVEATLAAVARFTNGPAFLCLDDAGRLQVTRYQGIAHDDLAALVGGAEFLDLVTRWRERPVPPGEPEVVELGGHGAVMVAAPLASRPPAGDAGGGGLGALVLLVAPVDAAASVRLLGALTPHVVAALHRANDTRELARRDREVDGVVQASLSPVVVLDKDGRFLRLNAPACELFGLSGSFDSGRSARGLLGDGALEALVFDAEHSDEIDVEIGSPARHFRASVTRIHDGAERLRTVVALEDVSARRRHEQAHDDFVSVIGHELRTPLTVAKGFVETVVARPDALGPGDADAFLGKALGQIERLDDLINDLLFISTERPREAVLVEPCDAYDLALAVVRRLSARHPERTIDCLVLGGVTETVTDGRLVSHALRHLLDNALKYSEGDVRVELHGDAEGLEMAVIDHGPGIFSGDLDRLFQPFEQLDSSSTRRQGGTGLGLFLARRLVESLGGRLDCDSRLGQGSRFFFRLPGAKRATMPLRGTDHVRAPGR